MTMNEQMSLENFKQQVRLCLKNLNTPQSRIENLMRECEDDIVDTYKTSCEPMSVAVPMALNLI